MSTFNHCGLSPCIIWIIKIRNHLSAGGPAPQILFLPDMRHIQHLSLIHIYSGNKRYQSLPKYGMASDFKPHTGRITLTSPLVRGILHAYECANEGSITVDANIAPCQIALYTVKISPSQREYVLLAGETDSGISLTDAECRQILSLPVLAYTCLLYTSRCV